MKKFPYGSVIDFKCRMNYTNSTLTQTKQRQLLSLKKDVIIMKIEKLNDRQIRCTLYKNDLTERELRISELAYGSDKAKALFQEMMQKAYTEFGFEAEDIPLMIEAIPVSGECLILVVTKVDNPEELDTRFSKFTNSINIDDDNDGSEYEISKDGTDTSSVDSPNINNVARESLMNCFGQISDLIEKVAKQTGKTFVPLNAAIPGEKQPAHGKTAKKADTQVPDAGTSNSAKKNYFRLYRFSSLEQVIRTCNYITPYFNGSSTLYKMLDKPVYMLLLYPVSENDSSFARVCSIISECATGERTGYATLNFLNEHMKLIAKDTAVQTMAKM